MPASCNVSAAFKPAMPPPTMAIRGVALAKAPIGPVTAATPTAAPPTLMNSRRLTRRSKWAASRWTAVSSGVRAIPLPPCRQSVKPLTSVGKSLDLLCGGHRLDPSGGGRAGQPRGDHHRDDRDQDHEKDH